MWSSTNLPVHFNNWSENEPNNGDGEEHCAVMVAQFNDTWTWNDENCRQFNPYICQKVL
jgi:hypothetical protein